MMTIRDWTKSPVITIAVPTYNNARTLEKALDSCVAQSDLANCEILVVNNASTDGTDAIVNRYADHSVVRWIRNPETVTLWENHNICLENANGKYVLFCHSDDTLDLDAIAILKAQLASRGYPRKYVCWGHSLFRDYSRMLARHDYRIGQLFAGESAAAPFLVGGVTPSGTCYSRDILEYGGFVQSTHRLAPSDSSTMVYLALKGFRFEMMQQLIFFRTDASTLVKETSEDDKLEAYCDTYGYLVERMSRDELLKLFRLVRGFHTPPYSFLCFAAGHFPRETLQELMRRARRSPLVATKPAFWRALFKAVTFRQRDPRAADLPPMT